MSDEITTEELLNMRVVPEQQADLAAVQVALGIGPNSTSDERIAMLTQQRDVARNAHIRLIVTLSQDAMFKRATEAEDRELALLDLLKRVGEAVVHSTQYDEVGDPVDCALDCVACVVTEALEELPDVPPAAALPAAAVPTKDGGQPSKALHEAAEQIEAHLRANGDAPIWWKTFMRDRVTAAVPTEDGARWYAHPNDLIGGWCVMDVDLPPSQAVGSHFMADSLSEAQARLIASLQNRATAVSVLPAEPTDEMIWAAKMRLREMTQQTAYDDMAEEAIRAALAAGAPR